jgi:hypothetical protein
MASLVAKIIAARVLAASLAVDDIISVNDMMIVNDG